MLMMKAGIFQPKRLVSLRAIEERYSSIETREDGALSIGALASLSTLQRSEAARSHAPAIAQTLNTLSNVRVRNVATVGGHLAHADPHMDLPPVLIALDAQARTAGPSGERSMAVQDLFVSYMETALASNELITQVIVPRQKARAVCYLKCTTRSADDWPTLGVAVSVETDGDKIKAPRVVVSAATERPTRLGMAEQELDGADIDIATLRRVGDAAAEEAQLLPDAHGSAAYKRQLLRVYVTRALYQALGISTNGARV